MRYVSVPTEIKALQWKGDNQEEITAFCPSFTDHAHNGIRVTTVRTDRGRVAVNVWDWIIRGTEGEFYPCPDEVFQKKYQAVTS